MYNTSYEGRLLENGLTDNVLLHSAYLGSMTQRKPRAS